MYDIIIVGAGPAGLTAAIYARRALKKTLVLEASSYGGQIINALDIENYPAQAHIAGFDLATNMYKQANELGAEFLFERAISIKKNDKDFYIETSNGKYLAKTVIIATGVNNRRLDLENEKEFLERGISYCATCDGNFYKNKIVAVVGGGNTALEDALYLSNISKRVYLIHRRDSFRASQSIVDKCKNINNIDIIYNSNITKLIGNEKLEKIEIMNHNKERKVLEVDGLFVAIGKVPANEIVEDIVSLDKDGYIKAGENCFTNIDGIFVAGDNRTKELRQLVTATSDGAVAATEAIKYISNSI